MGVTKPWLRFCPTVCWKIRLHLKVAASLVLPVRESVALPEALEAPALARRPRSDAQIVQVRSFAIAVEKRVQSQMPNDEFARQAPT